MGDPFADAARAAAGQPPVAGTESPAVGELIVRPVPEGGESQLPVVVDTASGEVYDSASDLPSDRLAELLYRVCDAEAGYRIWRRVAEDELRTRLEREGRREAVVGGFALQIVGGRSRRWNADELEAAAQTLIDANVITAGEIADLITREPKVNGTQARTLLERLSGPSREIVANAFRWEDRRPTVNIEPVPPELEPGS
jgi:hypothetical protein